MKNLKLNRVLSLVLVAAMCALAVPTNAFAEAIQTEQASQEVSVTEGDGTENTDNIASAQDNAEDEDSDKNSEVTISEEATALAGGDVIGEDVTDSAIMMYSADEDSADNQLASSVYGEIYSNQTAEIKSWANYGQWSGTYYGDSYGLKISYMLQSSDGSMNVASGGELPSSTWGMAYIFETSSLTLSFKAPTNYTISKVYLCSNDNSNMDSTTEHSLTDGKFSLNLYKLSENKNQYLYVVLKQKTTSFLDNTDENTMMVSGATFADYDENVISSSGCDYLFTQSGSGWNQCHYGKVYQGLASNSILNGFSVSSLITNPLNLFPIEYSKDSTSYIKADTYHQDVTVEFRKDSEGYWTLDSDVYDYVFNDDYSKLLVGSDTTTGFWPYRSGSGKDSYFGMELPITFNINADGLDANGNDQVFKFSGDDDLFVYIDNTLVLDLGGIHNSVSGQIDFATGEVLIQGRNNNNNADGNNNLTSSAYSLDSSSSSYVYADSTDGAIRTTNIYTLLGYSDASEFSVGNHHMTVVYFERGSNLSNCRISYSFNPQTTVTADFTGLKVDSGNNGLAGAVFGLFNDEACTVSSGISNATSASDGTISFTSLAEGTYYMKEITAPTINGKSYVLPTDAVWKIVVEANDDGSLKTPVLYAVNEDALSYSNVSDYSSSVTKITNYTAGEKPDVKTTSFDEIDKTATSSGREAEITLSALEGTRTTTYSVTSNPADVLLVFDASKSMLFPSDLVEDTSVTSQSSLDKSKTYYIVGSNSSATVYRVWYNTTEQWFAYTSGNQTKYRVFYANTWYYTDASISTIGSGVAATEFKYSFSSSEASSYSYSSKPTIYIQDSNGDGVADAPGTGKSRLDYLIESADTLIDTLPTGSKVSLVIFNLESDVYNFESTASNVSDRFTTAYTSTVTYDSTSKRYTISDSDLLTSNTASDYAKYVKVINSDTAKTEVKTAIASIANKLNSKTRQDLALSTAKDLLDKYYYSTQYTDLYKKYLILLTDGCPNIASNNTAVTLTNGSKYDAKANAESTATKIKKKADLTFYSVGIDLDLNTQMSSAKELMENCASSESQCYNAKSSDLESTFEELAETISSGEVSYSYKTGDVKDVVDERFYLVADKNDANGSLSGVTLKTPGNYKAYIGGRYAGITVTETTTTIIWKNQTLGYTQDNKPKAWTVSFGIVAKDDFLGGNMVATNESESSVIPNSEDPEYFPEPSVNVSLLDMTMENGEETVFLGDKLSVYTPALASDYLIATVKVNEMDLEAVTGVDTSLIKAAGSNGYTVSYSYKGNADTEGTLTYKLTETGFDNFADEDGTSKVTGVPVHTYTLTIIYTPYSLSDRETIMDDVNSNVEVPDTSIEGNLPEVTETKSCSGIYKDNVVTATAKATKLGSDGIKVNGATYKLDKKVTTVIGDATFTDYGETVSKTSATVDSEDGVMVFENLSLGTYRLVETKAPSGYAKSDDEYYITIAKKTDATSHLYVITVTKNTETITDDSTVFKTTINAETVAENIKNSSASAATPVLSFNVYDDKAGALPETGGVGTLMYTISGSLLILLAALLLYKNKKAFIKK